MPGNCQVIFLWWLWGCSLCQCTVYTPGINNNRQPTMRLFKQYRSIARSHSPTCRPPAGPWTWWSRERRCPPPERRPGDTRSGPGTEALGSLWSHTRTPPVSQRLCEDPGGRQGGALVILTRLVIHRIIHDGDLEGGAQYWCIDMHMLINEVAI